MGASLQANAPAPSSASRLPHQTPQTEDGFTTEVTEFTEEIPASPGPTVGACLQANAPTLRLQADSHIKDRKLKDGYATEVSEQKISFSASPVMKMLLIPGFVRPSSGAPTARTAILHSPPSVNPVPSVVKPLLIFACCVERAAAAERPIKKPHSFE